MKHFPLIFFCHDFWKFTMPFHKLSKDLAHTTVVSLQARLFTFHWNILFQEMVSPPCLLSTLAVFKQTLLTFSSNQTWWRTGKIKVFMNMVVILLKMRTMSMKVVIMMSIQIEQWCMHAATLSHSLRNRGRIWGQMLTRWMSLKNTWYTVKILVDLLLYQSV